MNTVSQYYSRDLKTQIRDIIDRSETKEQGEHGERGEGIMFEERKVGR